MRNIILFTLAFVIAGCAAPVVKVDVPNISESNSMAFIDLRPKTEKENEIFSLLITSEAYGTYRRGDALLTPTAIRIFQHRVHEKFNPLNIQPEVKVHHLVVYMNLKSELRRGVTGGMLGGVIGAGIAAGTQQYGVDGIATVITQEEFEAFDDEYKRTLYSETENPGKSSVYVVYLDAEVNGKRFFVKTMTPFHLPQENTKNSHLVAIETATSFFLNQFK